MSFILKALKKLENEKAARTAPPVEINSAILASEGGVSPRRRGGWGWVAVPLLLVTCGGIAYLVMHKAPPRIAKQRKYTPPPAPAAPAAPPAPVAVSVPAAPPTSPVAAAVPDMPPSPPVAAKRESDPKTLKSIAIPGEPAARRFKSREGRRARGRMEERSLSPAEPVRQAGVAPSGLTVSGIAYQDNPADSMAVVNGAIVRTGMTVAGARVEKIFVDRVRFRGDGGTFEVPLAR